MAGLAKELLGYPPQTPQQRLMWEILFMLIPTAAVGFLARLAAEEVSFTIIMTVIFAVNLAFRFILVNARGDWIFYLLGVVAGGGNDLMSMLNGVYTYTSLDFIPFLSELIPLWMILFWGQIFLMFRKVFNLPWFKGEPFRRKGRYFKGWVDRKLIFDIVLLIMLRIVIYNTYDMEMWIPALIYAVLIGLRFALIPLRKNELALVAILPYAFLYEGLLVEFGLYQYINPVFLGMPLWLFLWWTFLIPTILKEVFDRIEYFVETR